MTDTEREQALSRAMRAQGDRVYRLAVSCLRCRADAEDALQEVFLRYYRFAPNFRDAEHEKAWILRVTINVCRSQLRAPWRRFTLPLNEALCVASPASEDSNLIALIHRLDARQAMVIHLHYYEGLPVAEIARLLHLPQGTVKSRLKRGREQLYRMLKEES